MDEDLNPFDVPFCLTKLKDGVSAYDTADAIIQIVIDVVHLEKMVTPKSNNISMMLLWTV